MNAEIVDTWRGVRTGPTSALTPDNIADQLDMLIGGMAHAVVNHLAELHLDAEAVQALGSASLGASSYRGVPIKLVMR